MANAPKKAVSPIPTGYSTVSPYLVVRGAQAVLDFLVATFHGKVGDVSKDPDGRIRHAEVRIRESLVMMGEACEKPPMPAMCYVYCEDVDAAYARGLAAGGTSIRAPQDEFYGDRVACVKDTGGNLWCIATHVEDVSLDEIRARAKAAAK